MSRGFKQTKTFSDLDPLTVEFDGVYISYLWNGKVFRRESMSLMAAMANDLCDRTEEVLGAETVEARQMADAYSAVRAKYTGDRPRYGKESKYWQHFEKAAVQCKEMGMTPEDYCEALVSAYTEMRGGLQTILPYPSQLHGEASRMHLGNYKAASTVAPAVRGARKAKMASGVPIDQDNEYQAIRRRMSKGVHTMEDVAYMRTRQLQVYGKEMPWLADAESKARAAAVQQNKTGNNAKGVNANE